MASLLSEIVDSLTLLPPDQATAVARDAISETRSMVWVPNPGPQTDAYFCEADELFYGGQAGGGKTDLECGLALTAHQRSLLLRRTNKEASGLVERIAEIVGGRDHWNTNDQMWRMPDGRIIDIGGVQLEEDKQKYKGKPHDLICFDELSDFTESQYVFITTWNRSTVPGQRCRVVSAGNPPTRAEGVWVIRRWAAWLDPQHPNPARPGELRWYTTTPEGDEVEMPDGRYFVWGPDGEPIYDFSPADYKPEDITRARSRTFIPAALSDNPDLAATDYGTVLNALPKELREAYRDGKFESALKDGAHQTIPTRWVREAQKRWKPQPPHGVPMCAVGADIAQGGEDQTVAAPRYDGWYDELKVVPGRDTPNGKTAAGFLLSCRRDGALIIIDMGGGYGGATYEHLKDNDVPVRGYKGAEASNRRTKDKQLKFYNKRSEAYWLFREALDPDQPGGSPIALPPDPELVADLCAPSFEVGPRGIKVEPKEEVVKRIGRSTDKGDAVVIAWTGGDRMENWEGGAPIRTHRRRTTPQVVRGHAAAKGR